MDGRMVRGEKKVGALIEFNIARIERAMHKKLMNPLHKQWVDQHSVPSKKSSDQQDFIPAQADQPQAKI